MHTILPAILISYALLLLLVQDNYVILPAIGGAGEVVIALFVPIPVVALLANCLESRLGFAEVSGVRNVAFLDVALSTIVLLSTMALSSILKIVAEVDGATAVGRNTFFLVGLTLCARPVCRQYAVMIPVAWLLTVVFIGYTKNREPRFWTVVLEPTSNSVASIACVGVFVAGLLLQLCTSRRMI
ncbi:hypothetical protein ACFRIC_16035 [Streptomyces sp. NPDC056738]|uniref:hypothetical protein n=1 Tax=Streptomyces sp. NPDC056738 TaxID=3345933 RepID=UPI0036B445FA